MIEKQELEAEKELLEVTKAFMVRQFKRQYPHYIVYTSTCTCNTCVSNELKMYMAYLKKKKQTRITCTLGLQRCY